jgi:chloride channel protein, CIC family
MYLLLGVICGLMAAGFSKLLYWVEDMFERLPFDPLWWPAMAGVALGVIGYFVPRVLGVGYDTISQILADQLTLKVLLAVLVFKLAALVLTLGSGTSGGLLAPMFMASAALGAVVAHVLNALIPGAHLAPGAFALVAMGAVFGAASRASFAFIIFAFEITRDYNSVLPLMLVCVIADGVAYLLMPNSIMTEKLARRGLRIHHEYETDVLHQVNVSETMEENVPSVPPHMKVKDLAEKIARRDPSVAGHQALPIVDDGAGLCGIITRRDLLRAMETAEGADRTVLEAGSTQLIVTHSDESLHEAVTKMLRFDVGRLLVVDRSDPKRLVGYLGRAGVMAARLSRLEEEHLREPGWFARLS